MLRDEDIELVKSQVNMRMLAEHFNIRINRAGQALCPFHSDKRPSMKVHSGYLHHDGYYCWACGAAGTIFSFTMKYCDLEFEEAVRYVAAAFTIQIPDGKKLSQEDKAKMQQRRWEREISKKILDLKHRSLADLSEKIRYYEDLQRFATPYGGLFCLAANKIAILNIQWEQLRDDLIEKGAMEYG